MLLYSNRRCKKARKKRENESRKMHENQGPGGKKGMKIAVLGAKSRMELGVQVEGETGQTAYEQETSIQRLESLSFEKEKTQEIALHQGNLKRSGRVLHVVGPVPRPTCNTRTGISSHSPANPITVNIRPNNPTQHQQQEKIRRRK